MSKEKAEFIVYIMVMVNLMLVVIVGSLILVEVRKNSQAELAFMNWFKTSVETYGD